ncbi:C-GCAxxG-C-C family (seleno)protein [Desulfurobacterium atlanticum]|uniref:Putative redox-active protein (C_GCAxxG_C_C) n=1 Tax=Desulfurobacterium atlanticum TaxID=240169 RepID=A0A238Z665_9BACT|nr:C-GCAxxG-C-C family (seleno)protein [Desulfurobacterium atlanticum]SNR78274.1 Putative redox-active protein (C_GCAxxG_C_C) [Desulfurobacterium atlanticum]
MDRRDFIIKGALGGAGLLISGVTGKVFASSKGSKKPPYPYKPIDPAMIEKKAYDYYFKGHCAYGVFASILDTLKESVGGPYVGIPGELLEYGRGGINGWGTICGALNGAAAIIHLCCRDWKTVVDALYKWHNETPLPIYNPENPRKYKGALGSSISTSPICHISVMKWCEKTGFAYDSKARSERCARITADVAKKTVELLNAYYYGKLKAKTVPGIYKTKMECTTCHNMKVGG